MDELRDIIFRYAPWIILLPCGIAVYRYKRYPPELKTITVYLLVALVTQILSFLLWYQKKNNLPILHVYTVLEFLILLTFYYRLLKGFLHRVIFIVLAIVFPLFSILNSIFIEHIFTFNSYSRSIEALIFIFLSVSWFVKAVSINPAYTGQYRAFHYIVAGFLIYFSGSLLLFSFGGSIDKLSLPFRLNVWTLNTTLAVLLYSLIAAGLWKQKTT